MSLMKHSVVSFFGLGLPILLALPAIGVMSRSLGVVQFGVFTLLYSLIGFSSIFDAGLGRAVTRAVAVYEGNEFKIQKILETSFAVVLVLGVLFAVSLFVFSAEIAALLSTPVAYFDVTKKSMQILSFCVPFFLVTQIQIAYLNGKEEFNKLSILKIISGVILIAPSAIAAYFYGDLIFAMWGLLFSRITCMVISTYFYCLASGKVSIKFDKLEFIELYKFGSWVTVGNILTPLIGFSDRFILSHVSGAQVVAYYTGPAEMVSKMSIIPGAISTALFPKLSKMVDSKDGDRLYFQALKMTLICLLFFVLPIFFYSSEILRIWLGASFGSESSLVLKILVVGFLFNALAYVPYVNLQAAGKSKITTLITLFQVPFYFLIMYLLISKYGAVGAAIAWSIRVFVDFAILHFFSRR